VALPLLTAAARPKDPLHNFNKDIMRDQAQFPEIKDDNCFGAWQRTVRARLRPRSMAAFFVAVVAMLLAALQSHNAPAQPFCASLLGESSST
jgi:hypothetical protein